jgi:hypothetical protein
MLYVCLAVFHLLERVTYADNSYYLFNIIQNKSFNLEHYRYAGVFAQWLVFIAVKLKLPFRLLLYAFTIGPVIYHFVLFMLVYLISNNRLYVYVYLTLLVGAIYPAYFFTSDELTQNIPVLIVAAAVVKSDKIAVPFKCMLVFLCEGILLFTHPLIIVVAALLLFILVLQERNAVTMFALLGVMVLLLIKFLFFTTGRDEGLMQAVSYRNLTLRNIHSSAFALYFRNAILEKHLPLLVLWVSLLLMGKSSLKLRGIALASITGLYLLILLFLVHQVNKIYIDRYLYLLLVYAFAVVLMISRFENTTTYLKVLLSIVVLFSFYRLFTLQDLEDRKQRLSEMLSEKAAKQIYLYERVPEHLQQMSWSVPYETLLLSTLNHNTKTILIKERFYKIDHLLSDSTLFLGAEWKFGKQQPLDTSYFKLPATLYQYR